jgi:small subunit ribosomal protein S20
VANHASALKRHRQTVKQTARNQALRTRLRHLVRACRQAIAGKDSAQAAETLKRAAKALDKAVTKGVIHRNSASRKISRLSNQVHALSAQQS